MEIEIAGIRYIVQKSVDIPNAPGRQMLTLIRTNGVRKYVVTRYEDGTFSSVTPHPFG